MEINFNDNPKIMDAVLINEKDGLQGSIYSGHSNNNMTEFTAYISKLYSENQIDYFKVNLIKQFEDGRNHICVKNVVPFNSGELFRINTPALQHGINMIKGFFTSHEYREYVLHHSKRAKLIEEKRKLNNRISEIDRKLNY